MPEEKVLTLYLGIPTYSAPLEEYLKTHGEGLYKMLPESPRLCLLGDRSQVHNSSREESLVTMAAWTTRRYQKSAKPPELNEWVNYMKQTASHESTLIRMDDRNYNNDDKGQSGIIFGIILHCLTMFKCDCYLCLSGWPPFLFFLSLDYERCCILSRTDCSFILQPFYVCQWCHQ